MTSSASLIIYYSVIVNYIILSYYIFIKIIKLYLIKLIGL
nr:MAG TPA: hypothetical protein [Caudoviricetes sp.]